MKDNIIPVDLRKQYLSNMARYSLYVLFERFVPDVNDGLKPVQRRTLYCMLNDVKCTSKVSKRKSANTVGAVIASYHPHGDTSVYDAMKCLTNWFEIKVPLINYDSNSGSLQGGPQAAMRYTESYLSKFTMDVIMADLIESRQCVDWSKTFDNHTEEPMCLPVRVPLLLVNGTFGICIGRRIEVPKHSLNDVIDATLAVLHNPNAKVALIPDPCQKCEVVDTDWKKISNMGFG
jgi:DNA gyrase subunit A